MSALTISNLGFYNEADCKVSAFATLCNQNVIPDDVPTPRALRIMSPFMTWSACYLRFMRMVGGLAPKTQQALMKECVVAGTALAEFIKLLDGQEARRRS